MRFSSISHFTKTDSWPEFAQRRIDPNWCEDSEPNCTATDTAIERFLPKLRENIARRLNKNYGTSNSTALLLRNNSNTNLKDIVLTKTVPIDSLDEAEEDLLEEEDELYQYANDPLNNMTMIASSNLIDEHPNANTPEDEMEPDEDGDEDEDEDEDGDEGDEDEDEDEDEDVEATEDLNVQVCN